MKRPSKSPYLIIAGLLVLATITALMFRQNPARPPQPAAIVVPPLGNLDLPAAEPSAGKGLRAELREALAGEGLVDPQKRLDLLASVTGTLSAEEGGTLLSALLEPRGVDTPAGWHAEYLHNVARLLQDADPVRGDFARALATLARDQKRDETVRDYALQHLRQVWDRGEDGLRRSIEATFRELVLADSAISPSALLSLHLLGKRVTPGHEATPSSAAPGGGTPAFHLPDSDLEPLVSRILKQAPAADSITPRLTALRIVGDRRMESCHAEVRAIAADTAAEHSLVRMAAIANLAAFSDPADRPFLESLAASRDARVSHAVRRALASFR